MKRAMKVLLYTFVIVQLHSLSAWDQDTVALEPRRKQLFIDDYVISMLET